MLLSALDIAVTAAVLKAAANLTLVAFLSL